MTPFNWKYIVIVKCITETNWLHSCYSVMLIIAFKHLGRLRQRLLLTEHILNYDQILKMVTNPLLVYLCVIDNLDEHTPLFILTKGNYIYIYIYKAWFIPKCNITFLGLYYLCDKLRTISRPKERQIEYHTLYICHVQLPSNI